ncbi:MAG: histidine phosphatase family protein [Candidatus Omnitrophota bacterium]
MTKLILVRHGLTDWNKSGRIQGALDIPLNEEGRKQIQLIIAGLAHLKGVRKIDAVYASRLSRSFETAAGIAKVFNVKVKRLAELNEFDQGVWQGLLEKQIEKRFKKIYSAWKADPRLTQPPQGESLAQVSGRVLPAVERMLKQYSGGAICIVTHQLVSAIIQDHYINSASDRIWHSLPKNASWDVIEIKDG